jgi:hypothetical protein
MPTSALPNRRPTINRHDDILDRPSRKPGLQTVTCADYGRFELGDRRGSPPGVKSRGLSHVRRSSTSASHERLGILFAYGVFNSVRTLGLKNSRCLILEFVRNLFARNEDFRTLGNALQETLSQSECGRGIVVIREAVDRAVPNLPLLRDRDRFLWGRSAALQLVDDIRRVFSNADKSEP